ncbi:MAG: septum formation inhibitor Maf [Pseudomonadota bacterium]|nr:MAG: septum formation inhibitor Maf [Pseudomonadota bacterium]
MNQSPSLILASASPRRHQLLSLLGVVFETDPATIDESVDHREHADDYVRRMANSKARMVFARQRPCPVLAADTAVVIDGRVLGKPADPASARAMLGQLSGRSHEVLSAVALIDRDGAVRDELSSTRVTLAPLPERWIEQYVATGESFDKAGGYGIQGQAGAWVSRLEGSYTGVVGLPLYETGVLLRQVGLWRGAML